MPKKNLLFFHFPFYKQYSDKIIQLFKGTPINSLFPSNDCNFEFFENLNR
jgi:hypothetical protein